MDTNVSSNSFRPHLIKLHPCQAGLDWAAEKSLTEIWTTCDRGDWLLWLAARIGVDRKHLVISACKCARLVLHLVNEGENRPRLAIEAAEAWVRGEADIHFVRDAASAAYAAASAAYAAADAADAAAYAAADAAADAADAAAYAAADAADAAADAAYAAYAADAAADAYAADAAAYAAADAADAAADAAYAAYAADAAADAYAADANMKVMCLEAIRETIPLSVVLEAYEQSQAK